MRMRQLIHKQDGIALIMVIGMLAVLTIAGSTMMFYTTSNAKNVVRSKVDETSFSLSEAALNNAMSVLANPVNNSLDADVLPSTEATASSIAYENGTAKWYGTLDRAAAVWTITALGLYDNPTGPGTAQVRRKLTAKVPISPTLTQPLNNPAWDYMYSTGTGNTCDQTMNNNVVGNARMYVAGNLCIGNNAGTALSALIVKGDLDLSNNTNVGASTSMATRVETYVGGNCRYGGGTWAACSGNQDARHIYSKLANGTTIGVTHTTPVIAAPTADFASWYENAIPGPAQPCTTIDRHPARFRRELPRQGQQRRGGRPDTDKLVRLPCRSRRLDDASQCHQRVADFDHSRVGQRVPGQRIPDQDRRRADERDRRLRNDHLDRYARRQQLGGDSSRRQSDADLGRLRRER